MLKQNKGVKKRSGSQKTRILKYQTLIRASFPRISITIYKNLAKPVRTKKPINYETIF